MTASTMIVEAHPRPSYYSDHPQDPAFIRIVNGVEVIVDKRNRPRFLISGAPLREGGAPQCAARRSSGEYRCTGYAVHNYGYRTCCKHGAGSPAKGRPGGRPPSVLPRKYELQDDLMTRFEKAVNDPDLLSLDREIALIDTRLTQLAERLPSEDQSTTSFLQLKEGLEQLKKALETRDAEGQIMASIQLVNSYDAIEAERINWLEIVSLTQQRSKLTAREAERRKAMRAYMTVEEAKAMIRVIMETVNECVPELRIRNEISAKVKMRLQRKG
jgi:hypothetical protein